MSDNIRKKKRRPVTAGGMRYARDCDGLRLKPPAWIDTLT